jgi:2-polyprenyl-3-methyl-5-hydroxy-6-metoxy-1,4-benzoquinol methylase
MNAILFHPSQPESENAPSPREVALERALDDVRVDQFEKGERELRQLAAEFPEDLNVWGNLGTVLQMWGDVEGAMACYRQVQRLYPQHQESYVAIGICLYFLGRTREARQSLREADISQFHNPEKLDYFLSLTEPLLQRAWKRRAALARGLFRTIREPKRFRALLTELFKIPRSVSGIRSSGLASYFAHLGFRYLETEDFRLPIRPCDLCGSSDFSAVFFYKENKVVKCKRCGLEFRERKPFDGWDVAVGYFEEDATIRCFETLWHNPRLFEFRIGKLEKLYSDAGIPFPEKGKRVFEVGCAQGHLLGWLRSHGMEVEGIETAQRLVLHCREKLDLDVRLATIREVECPPSSFDSVFAYHVVEHLDHPSHLFAKAANMLKPGGTLTIETPVPDLSNLPLCFRMEEGSGYANTEHVHYFQPETIVKYYQKHGFEVVSTYGYFVETLPVGGFLGRKP